MGYNIRNILCKGADMTFSEINNRLATLQDKIASLPIGSITKKTVNGKTYFYHRFTENKKRRENLFQHKIWML